jgi:FeS assembly SUF system protein
MTDNKSLPVIQPQDQTSTPESPTSTTGLDHDPMTADKLSPGVIAAIKTVFDPEIPVNIHDLGLIYDVIVAKDAVVGVRMTLTAPACPAAQWLPAQVQEKVKAVDGVSEAIVDVVFDPPWNKEMMSEAAKLQLGMF